MLNGVRMSSGKAIAIYSFLSFMVFSPYVHARDIEVCGDGGVRIGGVVVLQDTKSRTNINIGSGISNDQINIEIQSKPSEIFFKSINTNPDEKGTFLFFGRCNSQTGIVNPAVVVNGQTLDGSYSMPEPQRIIMTGPRFRTEIILRSPPNASSAIFSGCTDRSMKISELSLEKRKELKDCYLKAQGMFYKTAVSESLGDIYEVDGDFLECEHEFEGLSKRLAIMSEEFELARERSLLRAMICREKRVSQNPSADEWSDLSGLAREAVLSKLKTRAIKVQMLRVWFDAFVKKISSDGSISAVALEIESNDEARAEWLDLYYKNYFWGKSENIPTNYGKDLALKDLRVLSMQYNRSYKEASSKPFVAAPPGRRQVREVN